MYLLKKRSQNASPIAVADFEPYSGCTHEVKSLQGDDSFMTGWPVSAPGTPADFWAVPRMLRPVMYI